MERGGRQEGSSEEGRKEGKNECFCAWDPRPGQHALALSRVVSRHRRHRPRRRERSSLFSLYHRKLRLQVTCP